MITKIMKMRVLSEILFFNLVLFAGGLFPQWSQTSGPVGGRATSIVACGTDLFASFDGGGIFRSTDDGSTWNDVSVKLDPMYVPSLHVSGNEIYAAEGPSVLVSSDKGGTWKPRLNGLPPNFYIRIVTGCGSYLYIATNLGVYISSDKGSSWKAINSGLGAIDIASFLACGNDLYAGTLYNGIFRSTDNGNSWFPVNNGINKAGNILAIASAGNKLFAGSGINGIYVSENKGESWSLIHSDITQVQAFAVDGQTIIAGGQSFEGFVLSRSSDGGITWANINNGIKARNVRSVLLKNSKIFAACYYTGLYRSVGCSFGWTQINNGINASAVSSLVMDRDKIFCSTKGGGVYFTTNSGNSWAERNKGLSTLYVEQLVKKGSEMYAATLRGLFHSLDKGRSWTPLFQDTRIKIVDAVGDNILAAFGIIYFSSDHGRSWTSSYISNPGEVPLNNCCLIKGKDLFMGTTVGVFRSTDKGISWTNISNGITDKDILTLAFANSNLIAGTEHGGVWMLAKNEKTWKRISLNTELYHITGLSAKGKIIIASSNNFIYATSDLGNSWERIPNNMPSVYINSFAVNDMYLFAGMDGLSVWRLPFCALMNNPIDKNDLAAIEDDSEPGKEINILPEIFSLSQNYPNPFNPLTVISYSLISESKVNLSVYNPLGQLVRELVNKVQPRGYYEASFNASDLPSGMYIYNISVQSTDGLNTYNLSRKMMLIK